MQAEPIAQPTDVDPFHGDTHALDEAFRLLRRSGPLHRLPSGEYLVVSQAGVRDCLQHVTSFVGTVGDMGDLPEEDTLLSGIPEPRHGKIRKIFNSALAYHHASLVEPYVRELSSALMEETLAAARADPRSEVEIMERYARRIPSAVIARILGIPSDEYETFARWSDEVLDRQNNDGSANSSILDLHPEFTRFITDQVQQRRDAEVPPEDVIARLLCTEVDGETLSARAVCTQTMFLIVAGNETTRNLIGNILRRLALDGGLLQQLHADRDRIPRMVEESLRCDPPVQLTARTCTRAIEIDGIPVREGDRLVLSLRSANHDDTVYSDPDDFLLDRPRPRDHVGFGAGPHVCPGAYLARMEAQVALETFVDAVSRVEVVDGYVDDPNPVYWAHGPRTLRVKITPRPSATKDGSPPAIAGSGLGA